jgi:predicted ATPase
MYHPLRSVTFLVDKYCFKKGDTFNFHPGLNLLVGDQGTGKSVLLGLIAGDPRASRGPRKRDEIINFDVDPCSTIYFDTEKMNPRIQPTCETMVEIAGRFMSHGEVLRPIIKFCENTRDKVIILDEPDAAMSPRSCWDLTRMFKALTEINNCQVLAAVHSPIIIESCEVLSLEHRRWMPGAEFLELHRQAAR